MPYFRDDEEPKPLRGLLAGAAGGLLAAWIMNQFQFVWITASEELHSGEEHSQEGKPSQNQDSDDSEDATMKAAGKLARVVIGRELSREEKKEAGPIVHYAFGSLSGAVYGLVSEYAPAARLGFATSCTASAPKRCEKAFVWRRKNAPAATYLGKSYGGFLPGRLIPMY